MNCPRGHIFDASPDGRCPMCGLEITVIPTDAEQFRVTRADTRTILAGLHAARLLVKAVMKRWPEAVEVVEPIESAIARVEWLRHRQKWGRKKTEKDATNPLTEERGSLRKRSSAGTPDDGQERKRP